jgi:enterochelin esterase-like enzyme
MRRHTRFFILASAGVLALGVCTSRPLAGQRRREPAPKAAALEAAIAEIEAGRKTTPLIGEPTAGGDATVTFLARRAGGRVPRIVSDVTGWGEHVDGTFDFTAGRMTRVGQTDWYSLQANVAPRARIEYLIAYAPTDYRLDPHNPRRAAGPQLGGAPASEFVMPGYLPPQEFADPPVSPAGLITEATVESRVLRGSCRLIVYTPPGYRDDGDYPVAVFLSMRWGQVSRVLDWLIAHQAIEPIVAVFVDPESHGNDSRTGGGTGASWGSRAFLSDELLTWVASRYGVTKSAGKRAIIGISFGAKDALNTALSCGEAPNAAAGLECQTDAFGRLGLLIPGRRIGRADIEAIADRRTHRLRVAILAGQYDQANVATARSLRQALADAGHLVDHTEVPEGHSPVTWCYHLRGVLVSLFGPTSAKTSPGEYAGKVPRNGVDRGIN